MLEDLGYEVDYSKADPYSLISGNSSTQTPTKSIMSGFHPKDQNPDKLICSCVRPKCNNHSH